MDKFNWRSQLRQPASRSQVACCSIQPQLALTICCLTHEPVACKIFRAGCESRTAECITASEKRHSTESLRRTFASPSVYRSTGRYPAWSFQWYCSPADQQPSHRPPALCTSYPASRHADSRYRHCQVRLGQQSSLRGRPVCHCKSSEFSLFKMTKGTSVWGKELLAHDQMVFKKSCTWVVQREMASHLLYSFLLSGVHSP